MPDPKFLTVKQAAKYLTMSQAWLFANDVPFVKLGNRRVYRVEDLDAYAARRLQK